MSLISSASRFASVTSAFFQVRAFVSLSFFLTFILLAGSLPLSAQTPAISSKPPSLVPEHLRCEYREDPLGIDSANPRLSWTLRAVNPAARGLNQSAYEVVAASSPEILAKDQGDLWDSGKVAAQQMCQIGYSGKPLTACEEVWWKVKVWDANGAVSDWSSPARWTMGVLTEADWQGAKWIAAPDANEPFDRAGARGPKPKFETILLRDRFVAKPGLKRAVLCVCGLGQYEASLNGKKVGDALLAPGWTAYDKTCLYDTYDVTSSLQTGPNAIGIFLGNGFYNIHGGRYTKVRTCYGPIQAIALIRLEYADGKVDFVTTNPNWKVESGPITFSSIYGGEDYDARLMVKDWDKPNFEDAAWSQVTITAGPGGVLRGLSASAMPIKSQKVLTPIAEKKLSDTTTVYDLGQNAALMLELRVSGPAGSSLKVTPSELVKATGDINDTMCSGNSYWTYTCDGSGEESYTSNFYYRGGRYLKVELKPAETSGALPQIVAISGLSIRANSPAVGEFSCSYEMYNKVFELIRWAQMNNMMSVMTDCPTREKLGWLEEDHLNGPALRYNFDVSTIMSKMENDMCDSQRDSGLVPTLVPNFGRWKAEGAFSASDEWGSACILVPWQQYEYDGDVALLRTSYETMKRYMAYLDQQAHGNLIDSGLGDWYDNHSSGKPTLTPVGLTDTAFYYNDYVVLSKMAKLIGKDGDATAFSTKAEQIRNDFNQKFFNPASTTYASGAQGSSCLALAMNLADPAARPALLESLAKDLHDKGTTAGEVSFRYLLRALADGGKNDLVNATYSTDQQGYGLQVKLGKTSLTEGWNGGTSQDHFMFGQLNEWFFHDLAGIQQEEDGAAFKKIVIKPAVVGDLTWAKASYRSISGDIVSTWKHDASGLAVNVTIPVGSTATVYVPTGSAEVVKESGVPASQAPNVTFLRLENGMALYGVGSGSYSFTVN